MDVMKKYDMMAYTYNILRQYTKLYIFRDWSDRCCTGGIEFDGSKITLWKNFFRKCDIPLFLDSNGEFVAKGVEWDETKRELMIVRSDKDVTVICEKPRTTRVIDVKITDVLSLCDERLLDHKESRKLYGLQYNVVDLTRLNPRCVPKWFRKAVQKTFHIYKHADENLALYYVCDIERRQFYIGLWDLDLHKPVCADPSAECNVDYSYKFDLFYPIKKAG